jgi:hypothetical protein
VCNYTASPAIFGDAEPRTPKWPMASGSAAGVCQSCPAIRVWALLWIYDVVSPLIAAYAAHMRNSGCAALLIPKLLLTPDSLFEVFVEELVHASK